MVELIMVTYSLLMLGMTLSILRRDSFSPPEPNRKEKG